jgi:hypothetical protein
MLHVTLNFKDGTAVDAEIPDARAFPPLVDLVYGGVPIKFFIRRGESVGLNCDQYEEIEVVTAVRSGPSPELTAEKVALGGKK